MRYRVAGRRLLAVVFLLACGTRQLRAQSQDASAATSVGPQTVKFVLKHFVLNQFASDPNTHKPLRTDGSWSLSKIRPSLCTKVSETCVEVSYQVPAQSVRCSWVIALDPSSTDGNILDENDDADTYMLRSLTGAEAKPLVSSRSKPVYPPIAKAARVSGAVVTRALISKSGEVQHVRILSGPAMLQQSSMDAVKNWKFMPMSIGARPVQYEVELVFTFGLVPSDPSWGIVKTEP